MSKTNNSKTKWIWLSALILFVCAAATAIAFFNRLGSFLLDDKGAISLITDITQPTETGLQEGENHQTTDATAANDPAASDTTGIPDDTAAPTIPQVTQPPRNPGFEASDDKTVWSTETQVEIFRVSYVNGEQVMTVSSDNGEKVIAPGTENAYTFKLKNTGNVALDYTVEVDAYFTPADIPIPITGRLSRYDGTWIVGGMDAYESVSVLDAAEDKATLGAGKYTYYTLDWLWPFESGNDEQDTILGNLAVDQDLLFTIVIKTTATESTDPNGGGGITPPQTGDNTNITLWIVLAVCSFAILMFLLFYQNREKRRNDSEADKS